MKIPVGSKIKFREEKLRYTVQASDERFVICTKPFNLMKSYTRPKRCTVLYSIIDFKENVRGPENLIFGMGAETRQDCREMLERLNGYESPEERAESIECYKQAGIEGPPPPPTHSEVSYRHRIELDIEKIFPPEVSHVRKTRHKRTMVEA